MTDSARYGDVASEWHYANVINAALKELSEPAKIKFFE